MFSFYDGALKNLKPTKQIDIDELVNLVKINPLNRDFDTLRSLQKSDEKYAKEKHKLCRIHPNCLLKYNKISDGDFDKNYISGTGYIYLDVDNLNDVNQFKEDFITKFEKFVAFVSISAGGRGISILIRINVDIISKQHYKDVVEHIKSTYFKDEEFDSKSEQLSQQWFVSFDPSLFYSKDNIIDVSGVVQCVDQGIIGRRGNKNTLNYAPNELKEIKYHEISININTTTDYTPKTLIEFNTIDWVDIKFPNKIINGTRRNTFTAILFKLFHLNPDKDPKYILAYVNHLNDHFTEQPISFRDLQSLFTFCHNTYFSDNFEFKNIKTKSLHFHKELKISTIDKSRISNRLNGKKKTNITKEKIVQAIKELELDNIQVNVSSISKRSGVSRKTVGIHLKDLELTDLDLMIKSLLNDINLIT